MSSMATNIVLATICFVVGIGGGMQAAQYVKKMNHGFKQSHNSLENSELDSKSVRDPEEEHIPPEDNPDIRILEESKTGNPIIAAVSKKDENGNYVLNAQFVSDYGDDRNGAEYTVIIFPNEDNDLMLEIKDSDQQTIEKIPKRKYYFKKPSVCNVSWTSYIFLENQQYYDNRHILTVCNNNKFYSLILSDVTQEEIYICHNLFDENQSTGYIYGGKSKRSKKSRPQKKKGTRRLR